MKPRFPVPNPSRRPRVQDVVKADEEMANEIFQGEMRPGGG
jgi:hypothetical protein